MNLLVGFVILLCLACSEFRTAEVATDLWTRVLAVAFVSFTVPGLALFQTLVVTQRFQKNDIPDAERESTVRRLSACHSAVWLTASLAIIWAVRWQDVVRGNWNFDRFPLLDEALILAPVVFSLAASWAIFYEIQQSNEKTKTSWFDVEDLKNRLGFVSIRFRVYVLLVLIPISIAVLVRDLSPWIDSLTSVGTWMFFSAAGIGFAAGFPFLLLVILKTRRVENPNLRAELISTCDQHRLFVNDVRIWETGNRVVNALVAGLIPRFRFILLSDSLVSLFPKHELMAVVRHEAGHLRLWHLPTRIGFVVLPLIALTTDEQNPLGLLNWLEAALIHMSMPRGSGIGFLGIIYLVYLYFGLSWLSRKMEFEADIYSCQSDIADPDGDFTDPTLSKNMSDALLRLASISPSQFERRTFLHPSIRDRIRLIQSIQSSPGEAQAFRSSFSRRRRAVLAALVSLCLFAFLI